jgi:hypothetical protein
MSLRERLLKLKGQDGAAPLANPAQTASALSVRLARRTLARHRASEHEVAQALGGERIDGGLILVERVLPLTTRHGTVRLGELLTAPLELLAGHAPAPAELLFLDTETTGLAGGTGTLPFLVGLARIEGDRLRLRQFFLTGFTGERALLNESLRWYREASHLVSFNGKRFDLPLLATRQRLARLPDPFSRLAHLDLLFPTRTAFARRWPDCRLTTAERRLLDFHRIDDLPSHLVPQAWFDFVRAGRLDEIPAILEHNRLDLLSLAALAVRLAQLFDRPDHPEADVTRIARHFRRLGDEQAAKTRLHRRREALDQAGLLELARMERREGRWQAAVEIWQRLSAEDCLEAVECLAKHHEHVSRDFQLALALTERLLAHAPGDGRHLRRRQRLLARMGMRD